MWGRLRRSFGFICLGLAAGGDLLAMDQRRVEDILPKVKQYLDQAKGEWKVPGVSIAIYDHGEVQYINAGVQSIAKKGSTTEETVFCVMSCTKIVTVLVIHRLAEEGKLGLEDRVIDWLPWFKLSDDEETKKVRVKHLLAHCIGLQSFSGDDFWHLGFSQPEIFERLSKLKMQHKVGEEYGYQNMFVAMAGEIIKKATGQLLSEVYQRYIFDPLDMTRSSLGRHPKGFWSWMKGLFKSDPRHDAKGMATGYSWRHGGPQPTECDDQYVLPATSGVNSSTADYIKLIACLVHHGVIQFGPYKGQRLISEDSWKWITSPQSHIRHVREDNSQFPVPRIEPGSFYYGNGVFGMKYGVEGSRINLLVHMGSGSGWRTLWGAVPDGDFGVVIFTNLGSINSNMLPEALLYKIIDLAFQFPPLDWQERTFRNQRMHRKFLTHQYDSTIVGPPVEAVSLVGRYTNDLYGNAAIILKDGQPVLVYRKRKVPLTLIGGTVYSFDAYDLNPHDGDDERGQLFFQLSSSGNIKGLTIDGLRDGDPHFKFEPSHK